MLSYPPGRQLNQKRGIMLIGKRLKEIREAKNISLTELSKKSGVQLATLSRIENLKMIGTVESHINIARALGVDLTQLYKGIIKEKKSADTDTKSPKALTETFSHSDQAYYEILTSNVLSKKMMPILLKIEPKGKTNPEQNQAGAEKFIFVLEGKIEVMVGDKAYPLAKDHAFYFDASLEHYFVNQGSAPAKAICVITPAAL